MSRRILLLLAAVVAVAAVVVGAVVFLGGDDRPAPDAAARAYLDAWSAGDYAAMERAALDPPADFVAVHDSVADGLRLRSATYSAGPANVDGTRATALFSAALVVGGLGEWRYDGELGLVYEDGRWQVAWTPASVHPALEPGLTLRRVRDLPERAPILGAGDAALASAQPAVSIGVEPQRIQDRAAVAAALQSELGYDPAALDRSLAGAQPDHFVPVMTVPRPRYDEVRPVLFPVPGIVFRETTSRQSPSDSFATHVLGRVAEATAEQLEELGPTYQVGDVVGQSGLEARYEQELAGAPSGEIQVVDADSNVVEVVQSMAGTAPAPLRTTLDVAAQSAVETALDAMPGPGAMVVVDGTTGGVLAAASRPLTEPFNRAFSGQYAPGSTFKVVSGTAFLASGVTPDTVVRCPAEANVGGRRFRNFEGGQSGDIPFSQAFAESCNTAFVATAATVGAEPIMTAAGEFGFDVAYDPGIGAVGGSFPEPADETELAAASIGQGRVQASPLHMASVAAAVAGGHWISPTLVPGAPSTEAPGAGSQTATLRSLMEGVVRSGSGTAAAVPGQVIAGKTGTAEFGTGDPLPTHAWFLGVRDSVGLAVVVEGGGVGGRVAAPLAARFFAAFPPAP